MIRTDRLETTLFHILLNKSTLLAAYLQNDSVPGAEGASRMQLRKRLGQVFFFFAFVTPLTSLVTGEGSPTRTYMSLILAWAGPVLLLLWSLSYQLILQLPRTNVSYAITLPTLYLWVVDTAALRRGTWSISDGTKLGYQVWPGLEVEEAVFFLVTNMLVVFGSIAFDLAVTIIDVFPDLFPEHKSGSIPTPQLLIKALLMPTSSYDTDRLTGLTNALKILSQKSRSFYLASGVFSGPLRLDLILLYAFCRIADDLVDNSTTPADAEKWIKHLSNFLKTVYNTKSTSAQISKALEPFTPEAQSVLRLLPTQHLPQAPLSTLLDGFRTDATFLAVSSQQRPTAPVPAPIQRESDLEAYASHVASTVAELCLSLVYAHDPTPSAATSSTQPTCMASGKRMGQALQYINVTRDVAVDAQNDRCYIPAAWFRVPPPSTAEGFKIEITRHREHILKIAMDIYRENVGAIEDLPVYARGGIRVAVESYMEIGRELERRLAKGRELDDPIRGKATVPRWRRIVVGWWTLAGFGIGSGKGKSKLQ